MSNNFLREDSKVSSIRIVMFIICLCVAMLTFGMTLNIIIHSVKCQTVDWFGMAAFLGAITTLVGTLIYGKVKQKTVEKPESNDIK